ncbi:SIR2 family protein [Acidobacteriia bacterium AH_259_A11_L15]|nr:SIR2 family protein [Acidobacteriia bacterium AH_259_A11_L15]
MPEAEPKKIAYLFGAGATHAELQNLSPELIVEKHGLLIKDVSSRVIEKARRGKKYLENVELVSGTSGSLNIELLISLIENSKIYGWEYKTRRIKTLVQKDIEQILSKSLIRRFYLHKALFELHKHMAQTKEELIALISLNYDDILDQAYQQYSGPPNYCFSLETDTNSSGSIPLLKLHGSFNWERVKIRGRERTIEIIPLGSTKTYLHAPYGVIWNRALEILIKCDALRVIGCSLSQNDFHLIDLLFKAHLERETPFDMEIISSDETGQAIQGNYGFFPRIKTLLELEKHLVPDRAPDNPFKAWLKYKGIAMLGEDRVKRTRYLKKVVD